MLRLNLYVSEANGLDDEPYDEKPYADDGDGVVPAFRLAVLPKPFRGPAATLPYVVRNEPDRQSDQRGKNDEIIQITENGNEIGNEIERGQGIRDGDAGGDLCPNGRFLIFQCQKDRGDVRADPFGAIFQF